MTRLWLHVANATESTARHRAMASDELVSAHSGLRESAKELSRSRAREITSSILVRRRPLTGPPPGGFQECRSELCVCKCDVIWRRNDLVHGHADENTRQACSESRPVIMEPKDRRDECWHEHHKRLNLRRIPHMQRNQRRDPGRNTRRRRAPPHRHKIHIHTHTHTHTPLGLSAEPPPIQRAQQTMPEVLRALPLQANALVPNEPQSRPNAVLTFGSRYRRARGGCTCPISCRSGRGWSRSA